MTWLSLLCQQNKLMTWLSCSPHPLLPLTLITSDYRNAAWILFLLFRHKGRDQRFDGHVEVLTLVLEVSMWRGGSICACALKNKEGRLYHGGAGESEREREREREGGGGQRDRGGGGGGG